MRDELTGIILRFALLAGLLSSSLSCVRNELVADFVPAIVDGDFADWNGSLALFTDETGDGSIEGIDLGRLWIGEDGKHLLFRLEVGRETIWQNGPFRPAGNDLRLYLDSDSSIKTGQVIGGIGADLEIQFGGKRALVWATSGPREVSLNSLGLRVAPTHSGDAFEISLPLELLSLIDGSEVESREDRISFFFQDSPGGDRLPDRGALTCRLLYRPADAVTAIDIDRQNEMDVRVLSHNVLRTGLALQPEPYQRYLKALQPDIINFQEVWDWNEADALRFLRSTLGLSEADKWFAAKVDDCLTLSRWPILERSQVDGNLIVLIDLPDNVSERNLVVFNAHTPCCGNDPGRDLEHDHMAATWRGLLEGKGPFPIDTGNPLVLTGDLNMVGFRRQLETLRDGRIIDSNTFGPDFSPGRREGPLVSAPLRHTHSRDIYTWRNDQEDFLPGKLDYILFTSDSARLKRNFTLYTPEVPASTLKDWGLGRNDSLCSDHLVLVADFEFR